MRSVPLLVFNALFLGTISVVLAGCGGPASTVPVPATASNSTPVGSANSSASSPGSSSSATPPPSSSSSATPNPAPSPTGTTISGIEQMSGWDSCDTCSGGGTIAYSMMPGLSYPQPGTTQFSLAQGTP